MTIVSKHSVTKDIFIHYSSSSSSFFRARNRCPPQGGAVSGGFPLVERTMTKEVKREVIDGLNTAQLTALCSHYSVDYSDRGGKKNNKAKCAALWTNLPKASDDTRAIRDDVWAVLQTLKSDDKVATFKERLGEERRQRAAQTNQSPQAAGQPTEKTVAEIEMDEGQATPEKQHDKRRKRSKENTP